MGYSDILSDLNTFTITYALTNIYASTYRVCAERHVLFVLGGVIFIICVKHTQLVRVTAHYFTVVQALHPGVPGLQVQYASFLYFSKEFGTLGGYHSFCVKIRMQASDNIACFYVVHFKCPYVTTDCWKALQQILRKVIILIHMSIITVNVLTL
jgi:hypothetical protein